MTNDIDNRTGWPDELRVLLDEHPRDSWRSSPSPMAHFWIDKHAYLRRQSEALVQANQDYLEQRSSATQFGAWLSPRLQGFLAELHGHHQIEDFHYFPAFRNAEPRLAAGFDVLARDHELIHEGIMNIVEAVNAFINAIQSDSAGNTDTQMHAAERYIEASRVLHRRLGRHLEDEEDLIIPVMLKRGH